MDQRCKYLAENGQRILFWTKFIRFWAKNHNFYTIKQTFWYPHNRKPPTHLIRTVFWSGMGQNGAKMPIFGQKCLSLLYPCIVPLILDRGQRNKNRLFNVTQLNLNVVSFLLKSQLPTIHSILRFFDSETILTAHI